MLDLYPNENNSNLIKMAQHMYRVDRIPVTFSDQLDFLSGWMGIECELYHLDAEIMLKAQIEFNKRFSGTGIMGPNFGVALEPSAFGAEIRFTGTTPPWVIRMCEDFDELENFVDVLHDPNPSFAGYLPLFYQTWFYMNKMTDGGISAPLGVLSSFDTAALLVGLDNLCLAIKLNPDIAHKLLSKISRFLIRFIECKIKLFKPVSIEIIDVYGDYAAYVSREDFMEFIVPYNKSIYDSFSCADTVKLYHCDGKLEHLIDLIPGMGCNCLYSFDPHTDLKKFVDLLGDKMCLMGNIDPIRVLRNGTVKEVEEECKRLLEIGKRAKGFILTSGGELANGTPEENIDAVLRTVKTYGRRE